MASRPTHQVSDRRQAEGRQKRAQRRAMRVDTAKKYMRDPERDPGTPVYDPFIEPRGR